MFSGDEEEKRRVIDNSAYLLATLDTDFHYVYAGNEYNRVLGYSSRSLVGHSIFELIHPDDKDNIVGKLHQIVDRQQRDRVEVRYRHRDGYYLWLETIFSPSHDTSGIPSGIVVTAQDISERRWTARAMLEQEKLRVMLQKEQEFSQFRDSLEHKIRDELLPSLQSILNSNEDVLKLVKENVGSKLITRVAAIEKDVLLLQSISHEIITLLKPENKDDETTN